MILGLAKEVDRLFRNRANHSRCCAEWIIPELISGDIGKNEKTGRIFQNCGTKAESCKGLEVEYREKRVPGFLVVHMVAIYRVLILSDII